MNRSYSLKKNTDIKRVLDHRKVVSTRHFSLYKCPNPTNQHFRMAFSVPKKYGTAVARNQMKRRLRMIVHEASLTTTDDVFLLVRPSANTLSFQAIKDELTMLLEKHNLTKR